MIILLKEQFEETQTGAIVISYVSEKARICTQLYALFLKGEKRHKGAGQVIILIFNFLIFPSFTSFFSFLSFSALKRIEKATYII